MPQNKSEEENRLTESLFSEFLPSTTEDWETEARKSLSGKSLECLVRQSLEGLLIQPIYHADQNNLPHLGTLPGQSPFVRGPRCLGHLSQPWTIVADPRAPSPKVWNQAARTELEGGADGLGITLDLAGIQGIDPDQPDAKGRVGQNGISLLHAGDLARALDGIDIGSTKLALNAPLAAPALAALLYATSRARRQSLKTLQVAFHFDPLGHLARFGSLPTSLEGAWDQMADLLRWGERKMPRASIITAHGYPYRDGGCSTAQEVGLTLATATCYLRQMVKRGLDPSRVAKRLDFAFSTGTRFFTEIAKMRCARLLWYRISEAFGVLEPRARAMRISANTSSWMETIRDPHVNILRGTVAAYAAVLGGAEHLTVAPFDAALGEAGELSRRIARNIQLILRDEAHIARVVDPVGGSWFVESLTDQLGRASWEIFKHIERRGGMDKALQEGFVQQQILELAEKRRDAVARRKEPFVGLSNYADPDEQRPSSAPDQAALYSAQLETVKSYRAQRDGTKIGPVLKDLFLAPSASKMAAAECAAMAGATLGEICAGLAVGKPMTAPAITSWRGGDDFECLRDAADRYLQEHGQRPQVALVTVGDLVRLRQRTEFAVGVIKAGGFAVHTFPEAFSDGAEAALPITRSNAKVIVLCTADERLEAAVKGLVGKLQGGERAYQIVVAGRPPKDSPPWVEAVDVFIYQGADLVAGLKQMQRFCGLSINEQVSERIADVEGEGSEGATRKNNQVTR